MAQQLRVEGIVAARRDSRICGHAQIAWWKGEGGRRGKGDCQRRGGAGRINVCWWWDSSATACRPYWYTSQQTQTRPIPVTLPLSPLGALGRELASAGR
jgi:hypothetical protein